MKARNKWLIGIAAVLLAAAAAIYYGVSSPVEVDVFATRHGAIEEYVTAVSAGTVKSRRESNLSAEVGGRAANVPVREGSYIRKGDLLALLSDPELDRQVESAQADIQAAREGLLQAEAKREEAERKLQAEKARAANNLKKAKEDRERASVLFRRGFLSKSEMEQADTLMANAEEEARFAAAGEATVRAIGREIESLKARVESAGAKARSLAGRQAKLRIIAPYDGVVTKKTVEVGETKTPGAPLFVLADPGDIYIEAPVDESESAKIKVGQKARLYPEAYLGEVFPGQVHEIEPTVEVSKEVSRANTIRLLAPSPPKPLRLGMSVDVEVLTGGKDNVLIAPSSSIMEREGQKFVYVAQNGKAVKKNVSTGISNWDWTEIIGGISPGEAVITSLETKNLAPGSRVGIRTRK